MKLTKGNKVEIEGKEYRIRWEPHLLGKIVPIEGTDGKWLSSVTLDHSYWDKDCMFYSGLVHIFGGSNAFMVEIDARMVSSTIDWLDEEEIEFEPFDINQL